MIIDGKKLAKNIMQELKEKIEKEKVKPGLAFILIGENPASETYVRMKKKACEDHGFISHIIKLSEKVSEKDLLTKIEEINSDENIHGLLVQQPIPKHISTKKVMHAVDPGKDVDGFHPINMGKLLLGEEDGFFPCTPFGITKIFEHEKIETASKHVVIIGRSNIVGKPLAALLMQKKPYGNATVTVVHSGTKNIKDICKTADILIAAIGKPLFVTKDFVKNGAVVIDVGINRVKIGDKVKIVGDVDFSSVEGSVSKITPVPGGVGPMTIAMLLFNTYKSFKSS